MLFAGSTNATRTSVFTSGVGAPFPPLLLFEMSFSLRRLIWFSTPLPPPLPSSLSPLHPSSPHQLKAAHLEPAPQNRTGKRNRRDAIPPVVLLPQPAAAPPPQPGPTGRGPPSTIRGQGPSRCGPAHGLLPWPSFLKAEWVPNSSKQCLHSRGPNSFHRWLNKILINRIFFLPTGPLQDLCCSHNSKPCHPGPPKHHNSP
ncbi:hypothetical protein GUJ93_ZPchr0007g5789 [Zizania palustris]|uniref:Uncharacterized protein n=1 Tax=Zizania palustris TaxID=103762 RepID=A0A8J5T1F3_ZIZPA|nr:hypothetical protein GUJ93_ZPchr0007g5789 [Zizania palustris]